MGLKRVSEDVVSDHKLDKLAIFHHVSLLMIFSALGALGVFAYRSLAKRLGLLEKHVWDLTENSK